MKRIVNFNDNWLYTDVAYPNAQAVDFTPVNWKKIRLPQDYSISKDFSANAATRGGGGFLATSSLWYRKNFVLTEEDLKQHVYIDFKSVFMNSEVWVNGEYVGLHPYGYIGIGYEITSHLKPGVNMICVKVDCDKQPQSRWYNGCGIYQDVNLVFKDDISVARHGTYITSSNITEKSADVHYQLRISNQSDKPQKVCVETKIIDDTVYSFDKILQIHQFVKNDVMPGETIVEADYHMEDVTLWCPETPKQYLAITTLTVDGKVVDKYETLFGIRKVEFIPNKGFFVNGKNYKMKGECVHHDGGVVGSVFVESVWRKRLKLFKKMGCNAIRTTHNPFDEKFYKLCDEMGFFVMDEFCDGWDQAKASYDYGNYFLEWYERDAREFIYRDRNHPSIVIWSIGNEIPNINVEMATTLQDLFHKLDPSRLVTCGICAVLQQQDDCRAVLDVAGYNDGGGACFVYERDHEKRPDQLMIATEAPHTLQTRGFYRTQTWWRDHNQPRIEVENLTDEEIFFDGNQYYHSSFDNAGVRVTARDTWKITKSLDYLCGEFRWTGMDYFGETGGWPLRVFEGGVIDIANFPKDHYYLYQSMWVDPADAVSLHILPHWTHPDMPEGTVIPMLVYTNCQEAELFLNGKSLGRQPQNDNYQIQWNVPYQPGTIRAVAYMDGKEVGSETIKTADYPSALRISCDDMDDVCFNGIDTAQIDCAISDAEGNFVPYGENVIYFSGLKNCGWIGSENGNTSDMTALFSKSKQAFYGLAAGTIRLPEEKKDISVTVSSILGRKYFDDSAVITIDVQNFDLFKAAKADFEVYYTLDGTTPDKNSAKYEGPFTITDTTIVTAAVYNGDELVVEMQDNFTKGKRPYIPAHTRGNKNVLTGKPVCTPCDKLKDDFFDGSFNFRFKENGEFVRMLTRTREQLLGYWGWDAAADKGEVWFISGEKEPFFFTDADCNELKLDNRNAGMYAFRNTDELFFKRVK